MASAGHTDTVTSQGVLSFWMARMAISVDTVRKRDSRLERLGLELPGERMLSTKVPGSVQT